MLLPPHTRYDRLFVYVGMEGDLLAALPPGEVRVLHRSTRDSWRLWLLRRKAGGL
ncbi:MAG: hypothetical protein ACYC9M_07990 [Desulfobulbaceae bacterium]